MSHSEHLSSEEEDLLQSALSTAFTPTPLPRQLVPDSASSSSSSPQPQPTTNAGLVPQASVLGPVAGSGERVSAEDVWKEEYEAHVVEWRRKSTEQRHKAEEKRAEWEAIREKERKDGATWSSTLSASTGDWENLSGSAVASTGSPAPADVRESISGEGQGGQSKEHLESVLPAASTSTTHTPPSNTASEPDSKQDKWDSMASSLNSSFPSMSFPSDPHSPISSARRDLPPHHASHHASGHAHGHGHDNRPHHLNDPTPTATISVFDSSLSPQTRALALLSSLAINVLLPFVNGVMLGFGEIFAKNVVVQWLGWKAPGTTSSATPRRWGSVASGVGLGKN